MKQRLLPYLVFTVLLGVLSIACQRPVKVLDRQKMENLMYDIYLAEALMDNDPMTFHSPEKKEAFVQQIFGIHHTNQEQWEKSLSYYSDNANMYIKMNDSVKARIRKVFDSTDKSYKGLIAVRQDIERKMKSRSYIPPFFSLADPIARDGFSFRIDSAEVATKVTSPDFYFGFDVLGFPEPEADTLRLNALLKLTYKDTIVYLTDTIDYDRHFRVAASRYIDDDTLKTISGFVRLQEPHRAQMMPYHINLYNIRIDSLATEPKETDKWDEWLETYKEWEETMPKWWCRFQQFTMLIYE